MKVSGNCISRYGLCPFFRRGIYQSGFTGKSGEETWNKCSYHKEYLRNIKICSFSGSIEGIKKAKEEYINAKAEEGKNAQ